MKTGECILKLEKTTPLFTIEIKSKLGKYGWYTDIIMCDEEMNIYRTYIDDANENADRWRKLTENPDGGFAIRGCRKKRHNPRIKSEYPIINADSDIEIIHETDAGEMRRFIRDEIIPPSLFEGYFKH
jgi:hypothetical protein